MIAGFKLLWTSNPQILGPLFWVEELMELRREAAVEVVAQLVVVPGFFGGWNTIWTAMKHWDFWCFFPQKPSGLVRKDVVLEFWLREKLFVIFSSNGGFSSMLFICRVLYVFVCHLLSLDTATPRMAISPQKNTPEIQHTPKWRQDLEAGDTRLHRHIIFFGIYFRFPGGVGVKKREIWNAHGMIKVLWVKKVVPLPKMKMEPWKSDIHSPQKGKACLSSRLSWNLHDLDQNRRTFEFEWEDGIWFNSRMRAWGLLWLLMILRLSTFFASPGKLQRKYNICRDEILKS